MTVDTAVQYKMSFKPVFHSYDWWVNVVLRREGMHLELAKKCVDWYIINGNLVLREDGTYV